MIKTIVGQDPSDLTCERNRSDGREAEIVIRLVPAVMGDLVVE